MVTVKELKKILENMPDNYEVCFGIDSDADFNDEDTMVYATLYDINKIELDKNIITVCLYNS